MSYRVKSSEKDLAGFISPSIQENGAMVLKSEKGRFDKPILCQSENDVFDNAGYPSADYPSVFEAISYVRKAPLYIVCPYGSGSLFGGVDVKEDTVSAFSEGRVHPDNYTFTDNTISHSFFAASPQSNDDLAVSIKAINSGTQFEMSLYQKDGSTYTLLEEHEYSLQREKDNFGRSMYIQDVFNDNTWIIPKVNSNYSGSDTYTVDETQVDFDGGSRVEAEDSDITTAWDFFKKRNKYPVKNFMDALGGSAVYVNTIITNYQPYAHGISVISIGQSVTDAVSEREGLSLDSDNVSLYHNWMKIEDPYNNSYAWISNVGSIGAKYAKMADIYDSGSPAGIDEDGHGGQLQDWVYVEADDDFSDTDLQTLDEAQINPVVFDETYGVMVYGDKTLQVSLSDTSYVGHRRAFNYLLDKVIKQVLTKQVFKNNDESHRTRAAVMTDDFIRSTLGAVGAFREWIVVCDSSNNTDLILQQRKFILDIYVKVTTNSQFTKVNLIRAAQNQVLSELSKSNP